jgi:predicted ATPase
MKLLRVQVPNFRALKDVDISFEPDFVPNIFPIGSQNGGGKSTLLQLLFVLLHCSTDSKKKDFVRNILSSFEPKRNFQVLANITASHKEEEYQLKFSLCLSSHAGRLVKGGYTDGLEILDESQEPSRLSFDVLDREPLLKSKINSLVNRDTIFKQRLLELEKIKEIPDQDVRFVRFDQFLEEDKIREEKHMRTARKGLTRGYLKENWEREFEMLLNYFQEETEKLGVELAELVVEYRDLEKSAKQINKTLVEQDYLFICNYEKESAAISYTLLCSIEGLDNQEVNAFLQEASKHTFLAAPSTQIFIFLPRNLTKKLFKDNEYKKRAYQQDFLAASAALPGLFTYDFFSINLLIDAFKGARDLDFSQAVETGEYGENYKTILREFNSLLAGKTVNISADLNEVVFQKKENGREISLYPEDLSHGELKRLSLYMWIRSRQIQDSIVLMDEVELAFHPDWQYQIVSDLATWSPTNQYLLATHSYELCQALTPAHVKEIPPVLLKQPVANP